MRLPALMLLTLVVPLIGCATAMEATPHTAGLVADRLQMDTRPRVVDGNQLPLRFVKHKFDVHVYDTLTFYVEYNGDGFFSSQYRRVRSPSYVDSVPRERWPLAGYIGVDNWPGPAKLRWTSLDGEEHSAEIDFSRIFSDGLTLHQVPDDDLAAGIYPQGISTDPEIHLEVDDRTVRVYQRARISIRTERVPGNRYTRNRSDLFLVAEYHY